MVCFKNVARIVLFTIIALLFNNIAFSQENDLQNLITKINHLPDDTAKVNALNKLAYSISQSSPSQSILFAQRANDLAVILSYKEGEAASLHNIGVAFYYEGNYTKSLEKYLAALKIKEKLANPKSLAKTLNNMALIYFNLEKDDAAFESFDRALAIYEELKDNKAISEIYNNYAMCYTIKGEIKTAMEYSNKSLEICKASNDQIGEARGYINIGNIYSSEKQFDKAIQSFKKSLEIYDKTNDKRNKAKVLRNIAKILFKKNEAVSALKNLNEALKNSVEAGDIEIQSNVYLVYLDYFIHKDSIRAFRYYLKYNALNDSIFKRENSKKMAELSTIFETENKEKQIALQKSEIKSQKQFQSFLIIGLLLVIALAVFIYRVYRIKKRDNKLLAEQNATISKQKDEIAEQKEIVEEQNKEITDSIHYASRIQKSMLSLDADLPKYIAESFILYKPRGLVSGDFYWFTVKRDKMVFAVADCTGHGVPGSLMSMLGVASLNNITNQVDLNSTAEILNILREYIINSLHQTGQPNEAQDGMDISLCIYDKTKGELMFSGANNPIYVIRKEHVENPEKFEIEEYKADKMPIGVHIKQNKPFSEITISIRPGDVMYLLSDGFIDQFDNSDQEKYSRKRFKRTIQENIDKPIASLEPVYNSIFEEWKGKNMQFDDVTVVGIKF